jgi:hypothetical protein
MPKIPPPDDKLQWNFKNAKVGSYGDESGDYAWRFELELRIIKAKYHTNGLSDRQIINFQSGGTDFG